MNYLGNTKLAEDINYDDKIRRFKIELARRIYKIVSGKTII